MRTFLPLVASCAVACSSAAPLAPAVAEPGGAATVGGVRSEVFDAVLPDAEIAMVVDAKPLRDLPFIRAGAVLSGTRVPVDMLPDVFAFMNGIDRHFATCGFSPIHSIDSFALSEKNGHAVLAAKFDVPAQQILACFTKLSPTLQTERFGDAQAVHIGAEWFALARGDLFWLGDRLALEEALGSHPRAPAAALHPTPDTVIALIAHPPANGSIAHPPLTNVYLHDTLVAINANPKAHLSAFMRVGQDGLGIDIEASLGSPELAHEVTTQVLEAKAQVAAATKGLLESIEFRVEPEGDLVRVHFAAHGGMEAQTVAVATLVALGIFSVRRVQGRVHAADARAKVTTIGRALAVAFDKKHLFPPSGKGIPAKVPRGLRTPTTDVEWQAQGWKDIGVAMPEPLYYQFEFTTAPDGKHSTVRAHGDLNGDGKESLFELKLSVDPSGQVVTAPITVKDEFE